MSKSHFTFVVFLVFFSSRLFLEAVGTVVKDKDVWSSKLEKSTVRKKLEVRFNDSAKHWTDALPIGNGRLGAMIWGSVVNETINLNGKVLNFMINITVLCAI